MKEEKLRNSHVIRRSYVRHLVPVTVWLGAVTGVIWLFHQRSESFQIVGIAQSEVRQVASDCTARITDIAVELFQPVEAGQTLAVVNTVPANEWTLEAELRTRVAAAAAEIERLTSLLVPTHEQLLVEMADQRITRADNLRRFEVDVESARLRMLQLQAAIASEEITLNQLALDARVTEKLIEGQAAVPYELEKARADHESLARKVQETRQELEQARADLKEAERRRDEFSQQQLLEPSVDDALEAIRKEAKVQEETMKGLLAQIEALRAREAVELKAPISGVVIPIHGRSNEVLLQRPGEETMRRAGEVVGAGDPILAVAQMEPTEIVAYANEQQLGFLEADMGVELVKVRYPAQMARSRIVSIGPTIELMPQRLWRNPNAPQWGRPVVIEVPAGLALVPGEIVGIRGL